MLIRMLLIVTGALLLTLVGGLLLGAAWATSIWPWPENWWSHTYFASILAAIAFPIIWMGFSGELGAMRAGAIDLAISFTGLQFFFYLLYQDSTMPLYLMLAVACAVSAIFNFWIYFKSRQIPFRDTRRIPVVVYVSFVLYAVLLLGVGTALVLNIPQVFTWPLKANSSVVFGWLFIGASVYFMHALLRPSWGNAKGQLLGFLAYDLILLKPYIVHFSTAKPEKILSLGIHTAVIVYSLVISVYYLFFSQQRLFRSADA